MLNQLLKAAEVVLSTKESKDLLDTFAREQFRKKYGGKSGIWYNGFDVISETEIRVNYQYGGGDMEMDASFNISLIEENVES